MLMPTNSFEFATCVKYYFIFVDNISVWLYYKY